MRIYLAFILCLLLACKKENQNYISRFTIVNAVPNSSAFTLIVGKDVIDSTVLYGIPKYNLPAAAGTTDVRWKLNGAADFDSSFFADLPNASDFSLIFYDSINRFKSVLLRDNWKQPESKSKGYIRFFPLIIGANQQQLANDTNKILVSAKTFASFTDAFTAIDTFTTKLRLYNGTKLLDSLPAATIQHGKSYSVYAIGILNAKGKNKPRMIMYEHE